MMKRQKIWLYLIDEQEKKLKQDVLTLGNTFIEDIPERVEHMDTPYLTGLKEYTWTQSPV